MSGRCYTTVNIAALVITTSSLPAATAGSAYSTTLAATGGQAPYTWSLLSVVPDTGAWLGISSGGVLSGTPGTAETETLLVQVRDNQGTKASAFFSLSVSGSTGLPTPTGMSGSLTANSLITVTGSGFGAQAPTILLYDDFEGNTPGSKISLTEPPIGQWTRFNSGNAFTASNVAAHTGSVSFNVNDPAQVTNGVATQQAPNILNLSLGGNQQEIFFSFWTYTPNQQFVGGFGNLGGPGTSGTIPDPGNFAKDSCWKLTWLMDALDDNAGPFNMCTPSYVGGTFDVSQGSNPQQLLPVMGTSFWSFTSWNRFATWMRGFPNQSQPNDSTGYMQTLNSEKGMTTFQYGTFSTNPLFVTSPGVGLATEFSYLNIPGYTQVASKTQLPLYDDIYVAVGVGAVARVEIGDASTYSACKHMTILLCSPSNVTGTSWADGSITAQVPRTGLDFSAPAGSRYVYVWNALGVVNTNGLPV